MPLGYTAPLWDVHRLGSLTRAAGAPGPAGIPLRHVRAYSVQSPSPILRAAGHIVKRLSG